MIVMIHIDMAFGFLFVKVWFKNRRAKYRKMERNGELTPETASGSNPASPENHSFLPLPTNHPSFASYRNLHTVYPQSMHLPFYYPVLPISSGATPDFNTHVQSVSCPSGVPSNGHLLCNDCTTARPPYCTASPGTYYPQISFGDGTGI